MLSETVCTGISIGQGCSQVQQVTICMTIVMETAMSGMYNCPAGMSNAIHVINYFFNVLISPVMSMCCEWGQL